VNLIVFDIDDTLTKSEDQHQLAYVNAMKDFGITDINQNWKDYKHHTDSYILKQNYEHNFSKKFEFSFIEAFENRMTDLLLSLKTVSEIKGAKSMIESFSNNTNYALAFATGSLIKPALIKLKQSEIKHNPLLVVGSNGIYEREGIVEQAIERAKDIYKVNTFKNIISVGDGLWDLKTARNLGLHFIGIGMKNYEDFKKEHIKVHLEDWTNFKLSRAEQKLGITNTSTN
jgi:phosphoglycolate phosphatase-like HAD superfamily hydrolase